MCYLYLVFSSLRMLCISLLSIGSSLYCFICICLKDYSRYIRANSSLWVIGQLRPVALYSLISFLLMSSKCTQLYNTWSHRIVFFIWKREWAKCSYWWISSFKGTKLFKATQVQRRCYDMTMPQLNKHCPVLMCTVGGRIPQRLGECQQTRLRRCNDSSKVSVSETLIETRSSSRGLRDKLINNQMWDFRNSWINKLDGFKETKFLDTTNTIFYFLIRF